MVITGDTGSGKSTQLPQYVFDSDRVKQLVRRAADLERPLSIVVTQPRRVAAISMTKRICQERGIEEFAGEVSYAIRFDDRTTEKTKMRYLTDGILVRECISVDSVQTVRIRTS